MLEATSANARAKACRVCNHHTELTLLSGRQMRDCHHSFSQRGHVGKRKMKVETRHNVEASWEHGADLLGILSTHPASIDLHSSQLIVAYHSKDESTYHCNLSRYIPTGSTGQKNHRSLKVIWRTPTSSRYPLEDAIRPLLIV